MKKYGNLVATILLIASVAEALVIAQMSYSRTIHATVTVKTMGVGVYWDSACTKNVTSISWGVVEPGSTTLMPVYIRNEADVNAVLSMNTSNWSPSQAANYITLSWNYSGAQLTPKQVVPVSFILKVSPSVTGITIFSFDIIVAIQG